MKDVMKDVMKQGFYPINEEKLARISEIKGMGNSFHESLDLLENNRENSLAKIKLEECIMWAVKGICNSG